MESSSPTGPASDPTTSRLMGKAVDRAREAAELLALPAAAENIGGAITGNVIEIWPVDPEAKLISRVMHNAKNSDVVPLAPVAKPEAEPARVSRVITRNTLPSPSGPERRVMTEAEKTEAITKNVDYLASVRSLMELSEKPVQRTWQGLLSGEINEVSNKLKVHANAPKALEISGVPLNRQGRLRKFTSIETEQNLSDLTRNHPDDNYKFYHSFKDAEKATQYLAEVMKLAYESKIALSTKTFDHDYDGINLYTPNFKELEAIIHQVYPKYLDAFGETEHFLQGPIDGVDTKHIGWVQEVNLKSSAHSHSGRMGEVGAVLDSEGALSIESYISACQRAGIRPETPWLLDDASVQKLKDETAAVFAISDAAGITKPPVST